MELSVINLSNVPQVAELIWDNLPARSPIIIGLRGDLGAGKTTLTQNLLSRAGFKGAVSSPTFVIEKRYQLAKPFRQIKQIIHIDAYRLTNGDDLLKLGWQDLCQLDNTLIIVEWPELVADILPADTLFVDLRVKNEDTRTINIPWLKKVTKEK